jgi:DNA-binding transcriptional ArsR family regulator
MSDKLSKTIGNSMEETKDRHKKYLRAINNPIRRNIIRAIREKYNTIHDLENHLKIDSNTLKWHLNILKDGYCLEVKTVNGVEHFIVTEEGNVVDFVED